MTQRTKLILGITGAVLLALLVFHAGVAFGVRQALRPPFGGPFHSFIPPHHGAVGTITAVSTSTLTLAELDGETETISFGSSTVVEHDPLASSTLQTGERAVILGRPGDKEDALNAVLIRILP